MKDIKQLVADCDALVKEGRLHSVPKRLSSLNVSKIPREFRLPLANLCRRVGLSTLGLKILYHVVHESKDREILAPASDRELAEYGVLLHRIGANREAIGVLKKVDANQAPEKLLFEAFCFFKEFSYDEAIPVLNEYIQRQQDAYQNLVGQVNLAAAMVWAGRESEAEDFLPKVIERVSRNSYKRLLGNCHQLRAQMFMGKSLFDRARDELSKAAASVGSGPGKDNFLFRRTQAQIEGLESGSTEALLKIRQEALTIGEWGAAREIDRTRLMVKFDSRLFDHLFFGTSFLPFRQALCKEFGYEPTANEFTLGVLGSPFMNLKSGVVVGQQVIEPLLSGGKCHRLIDVLLRDFYSPLRLASIFGEISPGERFDVFTGPGRVQNLLFRLRRWFECEAIPVSIVEQRGYYSLQLIGAFSFQVPRERQSPSIYDSLWCKIEDLYVEGADFSAREARGHLGIARTTFQRLIKWAIETNRLAQSGGRTNAKYRRLESRQAGHLKAS